MNRYVKRNQKIKYSFKNANQGGSLCAGTLVHFCRNNHLQKLDNHIYTFSTCKQTRNKNIIILSDNNSNNLFKSINSTSQHFTISPYVFTYFNNIHTDYLKSKGRYKKKDPYGILKFTYDLISIAKILSGQFCEVFRDSTSARVHTVLTSFRSELRNFLKVKGLNEHLVSVDLANSQVFMVNLYLKEKGVDFTISDVAWFLSLSSRGKFYEFIQEKTGISTRDEVKQQFFAGYFFCENSKSDQRFYDVMSEVFPTIHEFVQEEKRVRHNAFAIKLQQAESKYFIDKILPRLIKESPEGSFISTLHDSVITNKFNETCAASVIMNEFRRIGFIPTVKTTEYKGIEIEEL